MNELVRLLHAALPWLLGLFGLATSITLLASAIQYLRFRQASFFILRQRYRRRLRNHFATVALLSLLTVGLVFVWRTLPEPIPEPDTADLVPSVSPTPVRAVNSASIPQSTRELYTATPTPPPNDQATPTVPFIPTNTPSITPSHTPTKTPTPTPSTTPSVTPTPSITPTPSPTVPVLEAIYTPVVPFASLPADASIDSLTVSEGVQLDGSPVDPGDAFRSGQPALYISFDYSGMLNGVLWRNIWYRDENLFGGETRVWEWGTQGRTYFYRRPAGGFPPGSYQIHLLLEENVVQELEFRVREQ